MSDSVWNMPRINEIMREQGAIMKDIAIRMNESPQLISYYFNTNPTIHKAEKLAKALSVKGHPVDWRDLIV
jgi:hypothetical protein